VIVAAIWEYEEKRKEDVGHKKSGPRETPKANPGEKRPGGVDRGDCTRLCQNASGGSPRKGRGGLKRGKSSFWVRGSVKTSKGERGDFVLLSDRKKNSKCEEENRNEKKNRGVAERHRPHGPRRGPAT